MTKKNILIFLCLSLIQIKLSYANGAGIVLGFDDDAFESWCKYKKILKDHQVKATFFVTRPYKYNEQTMECIKSLITDGHEIAAHGYDHEVPKEYVAQYGLEKYIQDAIVRPQKILKEKGIFPMAYAYPRGGSTPEIIQALDKYYIMQRSASTFPLKRNYYNWQDETFVRGSVVDVSSSSTFDEIKESIEAAKAENKVAIFYAHLITDVPQGNNYITPERLKEIIDLAKKNNLPFYRLTELWFLNKFNKPQPGIEQIYSFYTKGNLQVANDMLRNRWRVANRFNSVDLPPPDQLTWTEDPFKEKYWRFVFYSLRPLIDLLFAYNKTKDMVYLDKMQEIILSFINKGTKSPYLKDPHTVGYLGISLVYYYKNLEKIGVLLPELKEKIPLFLQTLIEFFKKTKHIEMSNNHGVTESMSLCVMAMNFPNLPNAFDGLQVGRSHFLSHLDLMVDDDGVQIEQSPFYHFYTLKQYWDIYLYTKKVGIFKGSNFEEKIQKMVDFASYIPQPNGDLPYISASLYKNIHYPIDPILNLIANVFPKFKYVMSAGMEGESLSTTSKLFPISGFSILASEYSWSDNYNDRLHGVFDVGPFRSKHSDFDALSVSLYGMGVGLLPDSGLYCYETNERFDYYNSSRAHNLVTVGREDQIKGPSYPQTTWSNSVSTYQSGYHELYKDYHFKRGVLLLRDNIFVVIDEVKPLTNLPDNDFHLFWHLHPEATLHPLNDNQSIVGLKMKNGPIATLTLCDSLQANISLHRGEMNPLQGWFSFEYRKDVPNTVIDLKHTGQDFRRVTLINFNRDKFVTPECKVNWFENSVSVNISRPDVTYSIDISDFAQKNESINVERN